MSVELSDKQKIEKAIADALESLKSITDKDERLAYLKIITIDKERLRQLEGKQGAAPAGN